MSVDTFSNMIGFLDINSFESLQQTNQENKNITDKFTHIYYKNALIKKYGYPFIKILKANNNNYIKNIKSLYQQFYNNDNLKNTIKILEMFYNGIRQNKLDTKSDLFMLIYDLIYGQVNKNKNIYIYSQQKKEIKTHRDIFILKYYSEKEINDNGLIFLMNITKQLDSWNNT